MTPHAQCCHTLRCPARGQRGQGNSRGHRPGEQRSRGLTCGQTFAATQGTPCSRLRTPADLVTAVLTLGCHGGPLQAMVAACGVEERTVTAWLLRAGQHGPQVHQHGGQPGQVDLPHGQADELWVTRVGRRVGMAMALAVPARRWLGGVISPTRDLVLITTLVQLIRPCGGRLAILVCVEGWASAVTACRRGCRHPVRSGRRGRPRLGLEAGLLPGQMVKRYAQRRVVSVAPRVVRGTAEAIAAGLAATHSGTGMNTADRARLTATFRGSLVSLVRRGRAIAHTEAVLTAGRWLVGCAANFCWLHQSLRFAAPAGAPWQGQERTPAMAAGLTAHRWTRQERLRYQVPRPPWVAPKRRGRPPKRAQSPSVALAA